MEKDIKHMTAAEFEQQMIKIKEMQDVTPLTAWPLVFGNPNGVGRIILPNPNFAKQRRSDLNAKQKAERTRKNKQRKSSQQRNRKK